MTPSLERVRPARPEEWDEAWERCDHATFFHSRAWARAWSLATRGRLVPDARHLSFDDGEVAVVALSVERKSLGRRVVSSPAATYGGWITPGVLGPAHARVLARWLLDEFPDLRWKLNPFDPLSADLALSSIHPDDTQVLDLEPGFEAVERTWTKGHRAAAKQAFRKGVRVRQAGSAADWEAYFAVYQDSLRRWGRRALTRHPRALFDELRSLDASVARLWLAEHSGEPVAGALCFYARRHAVYWHGAVLERAMELRPVHALIHAAVRHACGDVALRWFDFNPSGPLEGVRAFKRGFGTRTLACPDVVRQPRWLGVARALARRLSPRA